MNKISQKSVNIIENIHNLNLVNIMVLKINSNYMITMLGLEPDNYDKRILLNSGEFEITIIEERLKYNLELERKSILRYMTNEQINVYSQALKNKDYEQCLSILYLIEKQLNDIIDNTNNYSSKM